MTRPPQHREARRNEVGGGAQGRRALYRSAVKSVDHSSKHSTSIGASFPRPPIGVDTDVNTSGSSFSVASAPTRFRLRRWQQQRSPSAACSASKSSEASSLCCAGLVFQSRLRALSGGGDSAAPVAAPAGAGLVSWRTCWRAGVVSKLALSLSLRPEKASGTDCTRPLDRCCGRRRRPPSLLSCCSTLRPTTRSRQNEDPVGSEGRCDLSGDLTG